jgi:hypothetical protein
MRSIEKFPSTYLRIAALDTVLSSGRHPHSGVQAILLHALSALK